MAMIILLVEALAFTLEYVKPNRHDLDRLAIVADQSSADINSDIIVFGDSVTQDVLKTFRIGFEGQISNLTTNKASGLIGSYLLLKRYLQNFAAPKTVVFASTPEFFAFFPTGDLADLYLRTVFDQRHEQDYINRYLDEKRSSEFLSLMNMEERIGAKIISFLAPTPSKFPMGHRVPDTQSSTKETNVQAYVLEDILTRAERPIEIPSENSMVFSDICRLGNQHNFNIHVVFAPIPKSMSEAWKKNNVYTSFELQLRDLVNKVCQNVTVSLDGILAVVPDHMMRDADHLVRHRGTNFYAGKLHEFTAELASSF